MWLIDEHCAADYLRGSGRIAEDEMVRVSELPGGVSNMVLLVERPGRPGGDLVLKQAREKLRTAQPWYSSLDRIWREVDVLRVCHRLISNGRDGIARPVASTPRILFEDRENYLFAMTAAPRPNRTWKQELLDDRVEPSIAEACGRLMATLHGGTWLDGDVERRLGDRTLFDQLRVDPYYRALSASRPEARPLVEPLIDSLAAHPRSLVHADFSPKNLLVHHDDLMMVDFETGHYGDPAFDLGFFTSHLVLKACHKVPRHLEYLALSETFSRAYSQQVAPVIGEAELADLWARGVRHFAACAWARLDGKSPVDYLTDSARSDQMRSLCREVLDTQPAEWPQVVAICQRHFQSCREAP
jgi:5-methylthioribose kinase